VKPGCFLEERGMTATWFAKKSGLNRNTVNKLINETDDYSPKLKTIQKVMKVIKKIDPNKNSSDFFDM
jgi:predicted transcriptional regulator